MAPRSPFDPAGKLQAPPESLSHFEVFGLSPALKIDEERLRDRFYELCRLLHPDRYAQAAEPAPLYALRWTTLLNKAYQTLRDRERRSHYLLELFGKSVEAKHAVPLELAETYFELQDLLSEPEGQAKMGEFHAQMIEQWSRLDAEWEALAEQWESSAEKTPVLARLQEFLTKQRYLRSMIADLEKKMGISHGDRGN